MILITEFMNQNAVENLKKKYNVTYDKNLADHQETIPALMKNAQAIIIRNRTQITEELLKISTELLCIGRLGVGLDNIDLEACKKHNVTVYPATGANTNSVVEYVLTTALVLLRGSYNRFDEMVSGKWPREKSSGNEIAVFDNRFSALSIVSQDIINIQDISTEQSYGKCEVISYTSDHNASFKSLKINL